MLLLLLADIIVIVISSQSKCLKIVVGENKKIF